MHGESSIRAPRNPTVQHRTSFLNRLPSRIYGFPCASWEERARHTRYLVAMYEPVIAERPEVAMAEADVAQIMLAHPIE